MVVELTSGRRSPPLGRHGARARLGAPLIAFAVVAAACADAGPGEQAEPSAGVGARLTSENGLRENGLRENGLRENGLRENGLRENGLATLAFKTWFDRDRARAANVMQYVAKCALRADQALAYTDGAGQSYRWPGSLGLAPGWNARAATVAEQEWVSACLMAFTNKCGNNVTVSLRAPTEGAPETERFPLEAGEATGWSYQEGAFFGNLFDPAGPDSNGCDGGGGNGFVQVGLGRECGSDTANCGYKAQGLCSSKCTISTNGDKYYKSCTANGKTYARVITTYLDPITWRGAMDCRNQGLDDNQLSLGLFHACARKGSGQLACWGNNGDGQLGDGTKTNRPSPVSLSLGKVVQVFAAEKSTCARFEDGSSKCWGAGGNGQLGNGTTLLSSATPVTVTGLTTAVHSSGGHSHVCSRVANGSLFCWGSNGQGQLGAASSTSYSTVPVAVAGLSNVAETSAGTSHSCARLADNTVRCWGGNFYGQLGDGTTTDRFAPAAIGGLTNVVQIAAGGDSTCARQADGVVKCWGRNDSGQLGNGLKTTSALPVTVTGLGPNAAKVATGKNHTCALLTDGSVYCWGWNWYGQIGNGQGGAFVEQLTPARVLNLSDAVDLSVSGTSTCARRATGAVVCWGANDYGQLGLGTVDTNAHPTPTQVIGL
jgi:alpha-tubulin suppressor-like RCC1 family protein